MGAQSSKPETTGGGDERRMEQEAVDPITAAVEEDDEPDDWDKRIFSTGCADENAKMTDCYYEKKDWRACTREMEAFKECWKRQGNEQRTQSKDA